MANFAVSHTLSIVLSEPEARRLFDQYLSHLEGENWIRDGKVMTEHVTSHRFDVELGGKDHPDYKLLKAIQDLRAELKKRDEAKNARKVHVSK